MMLIELVKYLRENILHDTGGTGTDWGIWTESDYDSIQLRWTNEELVGYINAAIDMVYRRINPIKDFYQIDIEAGTHTYAIAPYILKILKAKRSTGNYLEERSMDDFWTYKEYNTKVGEPSAFLPDVEQGYVRFYPIPTYDETIDFMIYRLPKSKLNWEDNEKSPELREEYQIPMLYGAASLAYLKDEANTLDPQRANTFTLMFDREFPFTSAYSNARKSRTTNRPIAYGGIGGKQSKRPNWQNRSERY